MQLWLLPEAQPNPKIVAAARYPLRLRRVQVKNA
jgi:hypothetical protein